MKRTGLWLSDWARQLYPFVRPSLRYKKETEVA